MIVADLQSLGCMSELNVTRTVHINAHRSAVWAAITEPELISEWFGDTAELDLRVGGAGVMGWSEWGNFRFVVEEIDEPNAFAFRWARDTDADPVKGNSTLVRFVLDDQDGGTRLTVLETGWEEFEGDVATGMKENSAGWIAELDELVAFLDKQDSA
ncbi:MAG: hypothetical protein QOH69_2499 [Actinomycetota bacterium]|jgi:uncharacterized protein YndB with AHSA1/START domain|nr:hypothetical protein [Actinomycetota bacterium]